ncbi:MAG: Nif3-like dinuclear metal center hexameric protein [Gemmatimonadaceae bacterium]
MTATARAVEYLDDLLETATVPDYPNALNGLQLANSGTVTKIAAAVDFSTRTAAAAVTAGADMLLVHHGMFWGGLKRIEGTDYTRLRTLIEHDVAVYSSHLPLDRHPLYGNNALLATELGLEPNNDFARYKNITIGMRGVSDVDTGMLAARADSFARAHGGVARTTPVAPGRRTTTWAVCTGAGASSDTLNEAVETGVDTLIVGEGPHHTAVEAEEKGIVVIYAGHYATETLGVRALAAHVSDRFGIPWTFVEAPTGL